MHQILFQFQFFSGGNPRTPATGGSAPRPPGRGGREGERAGRGRGEGKGKEGEVCVIAVGGDKRPWLLLLHRVS